MADVTIYARARAPEKLAITVNAGSSGLDLTTVTQVDFEVTNTASKRQVTWRSTIQGGATSSQLVAKHTWDANGDETAAAVTLRIFALLTVPGGIRRAGPFTLNII